MSQQVSIVTEKKCNNPGIFLKVIFGRFKSAEIQRMHIASKNI